MQQPYLKTRIALLGVGFLLEYLFPCVRNLVGQQNVYDCVMGTTADEAAIEAKQQRLGIRILNHTQNMHMLNTLQPQIILFAPQPVFAPEIAQTILKPYYESLRAQNLPLPNLYACPPSPNGAFYRNLLGNDVHVVNLLPNMVSSIGTLNIATQGVTEVTFPADDVWPVDDLARLHAFFAPIGNCVNTPPHLVFAYLGGQCALHTVSEVVNTIHNALQRTQYALSSYQIAACMRALFRKCTGYAYTPTSPHSTQVVPTELQKPLEEVVMAMYLGVKDACGNLGMSNELIDDLFLNYVDLHLHTLQLTPRNEIVHTAFLHATKGGVTEMALRVYYQQLDFAIAQLFADIQKLPEKLPDTLAAIRAGYGGCTHIVEQHATKLAGSPIYELQIEHHAHLFAMFVRAAKEALGTGASATINKATWAYGAQRGARMRKRAEILGLPLTMPVYYAAKEWRAQPGNFCGETVQTQPYEISCQYLCPWNQTWKCFGKEAEGALYCQNIDEAVLYGFNPQLRLTVASTLSAGGLSCEFHFWDSVCNDAFDVALADAQRAFGDDGVRNFTYHTAHLYSSFAGTLQQLHAKDGETIAVKAKDLFLDQYKQAAWDLLQAELDGGDF